MTITNLYDFNGIDYSGKCELIECKKALSPSKLPDMDYALNPYSGCEHGCIYCYAPEVTHSEWETWRIVRVKINITDRLLKELPYAEGIIGIGTVTDPYQSAESKYQLTRQCLEILRNNDREIHMHTKSDLILRDKDIIAEMKGLVAVTITGIDDKFSKITEPGAPLPSKRLNTLKELTECGIRTYALVGPVLSHLEGKEKEFVESIADTGVKLMYIDKLNRRPLLNERLKRRNIEGGSADCLLKIKEFSTSYGIEIRNVF